MTGETLWAFGLFACYCSAFAMIPFLAALSSGWSTSKTPPRVWTDKGAARIEAELTARIVDGSLDAIAASREYNERVGALQYRLNDGALAVFDRFCKAYWEREDEDAVFLHELTLRFRAAAMGADHG